MQGAACVPLLPLPPPRQLPAHLEGVGLPRPWHLQRQQLPQNYAHRVHVLQQLDADWAELPAAAAPGGLQANVQAGRLAPCRLASAMLHTCASCLLNQALPQLRSLRCSPELTETNVARPPCSTSGLSQRGLVAPMLVAESGSDPSITCGRVDKPGRQEHVLKYVVSGSVTADAVWVCLQGAAAQLRAA